MLTEPFLGCCGAEILYDFSYVSLKSLKTYLINVKIAYSHKAFLLAILNNNQFKRIGHVFLEEGFEVVSIGNNLSHPSTQPLRLLVYVLNKPKGE